MTGPKRVLVVDDDESIRDAIELALSTEGHQVVTASDGAAALAIILQSPPDVILLDLKMPGMDGAEFARAYRQAYSNPVPIVVMTAAQNADRHAAEVEAQGCLAKPFQLNDLFRMVEQAGFER